MTITTILENAAALFWLVLGIITAVRLRGFSRCLDAALRELEADLTAERMDWQ